jgi:hypothetical protein
MKRAIRPAVLSRVLDEKYPRMIALKKIDKDERSWDWFPDNF